MRFEIWLKAKRRKVAKLGTYVIYKPTSQYTKFVEEKAKTKFLKTKNVIINQKEKTVELRDYVYT